MLKLIEFPENNVPYSTYMSDVYDNLIKQGLPFTFDNIYDELLKIVAAEYDDDVADPDEIEEEATLTAEAESQSLVFDDDGIPQISELEVVNCLLSQKLYYLVEGSPRNNPQFVFY